MKKHKRPEIPKVRREAVFRGKHYVHKDKQDKLQDPKHINKVLDDLYDEMERRDMMMEGLYRYTIEDDDLSEPKETARPYGSDWYATPLD